LGGESLTRFEAAAIFTPFVNRKPELGLILDRWAHARTDGGQVVLIAGEPGIGKSGVLQEVRDQISEQPHRWLRCQCSPYFGQSPLYPVIVGLRRAAALLPEDTPTRKLTKLETFLTERAAAIDDALPLLAAALSIPLGDAHPPLVVTPERQKELTLLAIMELFENMSAQEPLCSQSRMCIGSIRQRRSCLNG
jgi:predicted ATPase